MDSQGYMNAPNNQHEGYGVSLHYCNIDCNTVKDLCSRIPLVHYTGPLRSIQLRLKLQTSSALSMAGCEVISHTHLMPATDCTQTRKLRTHRQLWIIIIIITTTTTTTNNNNNTFIVKKTLCICRRSNHNSNSSSPRETVQARYRMQ